ncbi:hypothetical protein VP01_68g13 [Puccinia sorghi]|uniref:Uncharacterized protein n=1 Tax=Puccinia sorghi TaxID=27349 RepID=A0A0L6UF43_9BASI|nr:hypothetical protein VP01_68g13 [Puccinia sorghi]
MANQGRIRVSRLSTRVFVAQISREGHGARGCLYAHMIVIPTGTDCVGYGLRRSVRRAGFYEVAMEAYRSQRELFEASRPARPIIRLGVPSHADGTNEFRRRILNSKHLVFHRSVRGHWCCRDWVLELLRSELNLHAFPHPRIEKLIRHLQLSQSSSTAPTSDTSSADQPDEE